MTFSQKLVKLEMFCFCLKQLILVEEIFKSSCLSSFQTLVLHIFIDHLTESLYSEIWCLKPELEVCFLLDNFILPNSLIIPSRPILQLKWGTVWYDMSSVYIYSTWCSISFL